MNIVDNLFRKQTPVLSKLENFGFKKLNGVYVLSRLFMNGDFRADITVTPGGSVTARVTDTATDEEYLPLNVESYTGEFVGKIRTEFSSILEDIRTCCFTEKTFISDQANRMTDIILEKYGESPDHPFKKEPDCGVFRYPDNRKWYDLVMNIRKNLLTGKKQPPAPNDETVEIVNLKVKEEKINDLLKVTGIYPAYHMKKTSWISITLDGSVNDGLLTELIDESRTFAVNGGKTGKRASKDKTDLTSRAPVTWLIPANPKYFDIDEAFEKSREIHWKQSSNVLPGDLIYMYVASPVSAVRYKCLVTESDIPHSHKGRHVTIRKLMKIRLLRTYPEDFCTIKKLRELGITAVRGPRSVTESFLNVMEKE